MKLRCQLKGIKCPRYEHQGIFHPDNDTVKRLLPDLNRCAECMAYATPQHPDLQGDLLSIASLTLIQKGPAFNPVHPSGANFGTFIRTRICGALMDEKSRELTHSHREIPNVDGAWDAYEDEDAEVNQDVGLLWEVPDPHAEFEDRLIWEISVADFKRALPHILKGLTNRERQVFALLRENKRTCDIAEALQLTPGRVCHLEKQVTSKLKSACQRLGLVE